MREKIAAANAFCIFYSYRGYCGFLDANGKLLLPGFNDAHVHFVGGGAQLDGVQLRPIVTDPQR
jgi:imidazolonepropionase-like amidohydrolase